MIPLPSTLFPFRSNLCNNSCRSFCWSQVKGLAIPPMTIRPPSAKSAQQSEQRPQQIKPSRVWSTLSQAQQTAVLQEFVTMCQECLLHSEEVSHDALPSLAQNHPHPS